MKKLITLLLTLLMTFSSCLTIFAEDVTVEEPDCENGCGASAGFGIYDNDEHDLKFDKYNGYNSLQEAFDGVKDGGYIAYMIPSDNVHATVPEGKTIELYVANFMGNSSGESVIINNGNLKIVMDSWSMIYANEGVPTIVNNGTLTIEEGKFSDDVSSYLSEGYKTVSGSKEFWYYEGEYTLVGDGTIDGNEVTKTISYYEVLKDVSDNEVTVSDSGETLTVNNYDSNNVDEGFNKENVVNFVPEISDIETPNDEDKQKLDNKMVELQQKLQEENNKFTGSSNEINIVNTDYIWLDINLYAEDSDGNKAKVTELKEEAIITIYLDDETLAKVKDKDMIYVGRIHNDDELYLTSASLKGNALTFRSNKFSTYTIVAFDSEEVEVKKEESKKSSSSSSSDEPVVVKAGPKDKNSDGYVSCAEEMNDDNWIWSKEKNTCVYKITNTSSK